MKIIDLLNKIANGEEVPNKILFRDSVYVYLEGIDYERDSGNYLLSEEPITEKFLNSTVEIIDDIECYKLRINKAIEELELWNPKNKILKIERDALLNILRGEDK